MADDEDVQSIKTEEESEALAPEALDPSPSYAEWGEKNIMTQNPEDG